MSLPQGEHTRIHDEAHWHMNFSLMSVASMIRGHSFFEVALMNSPILQKSKQTSSYWEKFVILQSIGIIVIKSRETRAIIYTCRYFSGHAL